MPASVPTATHPLGGLQFDSCCGLCYAKAKKTDNIRARCAADVCEAGDLAQPLIWSPNKEYAVAGYCSYCRQDYGLDELEPTRKWCTGCDLVFYCSAQCGIDAWPHHKKVWCVSVVPFKCDVCQPPPHPIPQFCRKRRFYVPSLETADFETICATLRTMSVYTPQSGSGRTVYMNNANGAATITRLCGKRLIQLRGIRGLFAAVHEIADRKQDFRDLEYTWDGLTDGVDMWRD